MSEAEDPLASFNPILSALHLDKLASFASKLCGKVSHGRIPLIGAPLHGSHHILFPIELPDHVRLLLKVPINGTAIHWDAISARALTSEALTMRFIIRHTSIPVPDVLHYSSTCQNILGCPYIIMKFIPGLPLSKVWFDTEVTEEERHCRRSRALADIAAAMSQLGQFEFPQGGQLQFDKNESFVGIGPQRICDDWSENDVPICIETPPDRNAREFYFKKLDRKPVTRTRFLIGQERLLRLFTEWFVHAQSQIDDAPFVLTHPDFDIQNIIVSPEGRLLGMIDWDGVTTCPRSLGDKKYPSWLTRDWDLAMYGYDSDDEDSHVQEDSPAALARYRKVYREAIHKISPTTNLYEMSRSLIADNLAIAASNTGYRMGVLVKIFDEIKKRKRLPSNVSAYDVCENLASGHDQLNSGLSTALRTGFLQLLDIKSL